ncbi:MAG: YigZ family protein [Clostridiales bacterium]|nr:YigZ family protein [Clostridiales bacterium]
MDPYDSRAPESYRSLAEPGDVSIEIERSRFIGAARRVTSEEEAQAFIASVRAEHPTATHVVWAYIIGPAGLSMRAHQPCSAAEGISCLSANQITR